ncbi:calcium/proton exchanger [Rhizoclosmatium globosum]|uniref:Calcium/proton exchanger n=1 Tax=Rhizoclosmatium globosum TaxID=329046 RepID=A0A1Y2CWY3_9FUNG|nr:calcium/proton exchanger [Rhizoclosmatium globosum]|eukprot:ORY51542.1 calcium/proton exchanger [Rhizoclosmatium globosum]
MQAGTATTTDIPISDNPGPLSIRSASGHPLTTAQSLKMLWTGILYYNIASCIFVPLGIISHLLKWGDVPTFVLNVLAIMPLAKMLDYCTDQLSMQIGETLGGLLNATMGNAVELIVGVLALKGDELRVVQASLIGSMLSNMLLVLGLCFLCGGLFPYRKNGYQKFDVDKSNVNNGLLTVVILGFIVPTAFNMTLQETDTQSILSISRGTATVLLVTYVAFLVFQLSTNPDGNLVTPADMKKEALALAEPDSPVAELTVVNTRHNMIRGLSFNSNTSLGTTPSRNTPRPSLRVIRDPSFHSVARTPTYHSAARKSLKERQDEEDVPEVLGWIAMVALLVTTVVIGVCAEFLVDSLDGLSAKAGLSKTFIGIIILPIVGNAAEHVTAVSAAMRNKMDLVIAVAVGSSMQIALLVTPVLVLVGWMMGKELTLDFELFETAVLFVSIFVVSTLIADGKTNWLEGWMLLASYTIISVAFFFVKD